VSLREYWARRPELFLLPAIVGWALVNFDVSGLGVNVPMLLWNTALLNGHGISNPVLALTYPLVVASFAGSVWFLRDLGISRALLVAITVPFGGLMAFEVPWHLVGLVSPGFPAPINAAGWAILASWSVVGAMSFPYWRRSTAFFVTGSAFLGLWASWWAVGYPQIGTGAPIAYLFNFAGKGLAFVTFLLLVWRRGMDSPLAEPRTEPQSVAVALTPLGSDGGALWKSDSREM
jgi:hypothetical protein